MDHRRAPRTVIDPKVRHVGFFTPPDRSQSVPLPPSSTSSPPLSDLSPSGTSLSPVMIPPPRHTSDLITVPDGFAPTRLLSPLQRFSGESVIPVGSYNPSEFASPSVGDFFEEKNPRSPGPRRSRGGGGGGSGKVASSLPAGGFEMPVEVKPKSLTTVSVVSSLRPNVTDKVGEQSIESQDGSGANSKQPLKEKTSKAERRALQEAQRAAKAAAKGANGVVNMKTGKVNNVQKKDNASVAATSEKRVVDHKDKDRKKDVPHPRMQFDDATRVEKAKKRAIVKQTEVRNRVELFRHLPQYEHGTKLPHLEYKFFHLNSNSVHPAVYKVGLRYLAGDISGGNARCIAMLQAFQESIMEYSAPPEKALNRDLTAKINSYVSFLIECRPLSISMGNAIKFVKTRIANLPVTLSESEAKANLLSEINNFINEKIILADKVIVRHAVTKVRDGDVLLTYGSSSAVEMIFLHAHELGKHFRVVIVDSRPKLEGRLLLRRLVGRGISCTYVHINATSYIMHEVTRVFLGASSVLANGTVYSRVGTACVAMVANACGVPVIVCCEAYKFHERVQLDSICCNELGDPDAISKVRGRDEVNHLKDIADNENLQLLNLTYDVTPSDYVSMIITDYGMIPPTSVPVIVREFRKEQIWSS
ncbi:putative nagB/RpiA transferase [Helianthus annuus]|uniref:Translation initiation factor eIF2B subunit delta n=2 Tax=Helianthus annuus TaxID=4232 RepID=A0A251SB31_HELAN|nr:translation initiation factor eIF-2B subunit delta isoform X1 [Helianthus annuus]KAF5765823.1 putative nagB/RpiA transferase [Helianthus annuus]KAJ0474201.1 putative nagB/RpiA transferase, initiation factor 2B-like protein [Helianthus annuus]KAJ0832530.1 putative nagB/RpiA transferase [Helianthus annuus]